MIPMLLIVLCAFAAGMALGIVLGFAMGRTANEPY